jgi:hypothetical protein
VAGIDPHPAVVADGQLLEVRGLGELLLEDGGDRDVEVGELVEGEQAAPLGVEQAQPPHARAVAVALGVDVGHPPVLQRRGPAAEPQAGTTVAVALVRSQPKPLHRGDPRARVQAHAHAGEVVELVGDHDLVGHEQAAIDLLHVRVEGGQPVGSAQAEGVPAARVGCVASLSVGARHRASSGARVSSDRATTGGG